MSKTNSRNFVKIRLYHLRLSCCMKYYLVWVSNPQFKSSKPLTYSYEGVLEDGSIVSVPFRNKTVVGLVETETSKPEFKTKEIDR